MRHSSLPYLVAGLLLGCGDSTGPDRLVSLATLDVVPLPCKAGTCSTVITIEARDTDSDELLATGVWIQGDGHHPGVLRTNTAGLVTFTWSYPAVVGRYNLSVCPSSNLDDGCARFLDIVRRSPALSARGAMAGR
jgi:hypothetical protein